MSYQFRVDSYNTINLENQLLFRWADFSQKEGAVDKLRSRLSLPKNNPIKQLFYLTTLCLDTMKSPFTNIDQIVLEKSHYAHTRTYRWLVGGLVATVIFGCTPFLSAWVNRSYEGDSFQQDLVNAGLNSAVAITVGTVSYLATGFFPDHSSQADDAKLIAALDSQKVYSQLAYQLLELYYGKERELAELIVQHLDYAMIHEKVNKGLHNERFATLILKKLKMTVEWIKSQKPADDPKFNRYIMRLQRKYASRDRS